MSETPYTGTYYVLPAWNEEIALGKVLADLRTVDPLGHIIVVDDASCDETIKAAESGGAYVLPMVTQLGPWGAMQAGMRYAAEKGCWRVITMDSDGQHLPSQIARLTDAMNQTDANVVIGACSERGSFLRKFAWTIMKLFSGISAEDLTSGFRLYDRRAIELLVGEEASYLEHQDMGVLARLLGNGMKVVEVDVEMHPRVSGTSRIFNSWLKVLWYMLQTLLLSVSKRRVERVNLEKYKAASAHD